LHRLTAGRSPGHLSFGRGQDPFQPHSNGLLVRNDADVAGTDPRVTSPEILLGFVLCLLGYQLSL
jgi:hypothetical protein